MLFAKEEWRKSSDCTLEISGEAHTALRAVLVGNPGKAVRMTFGGFG